MSDALTCIESFCGAGGLALGLERAGFRLLTAFDWDQPAIDTLRHNLPQVDAWQADASAVTASQLRERAGLEADQRPDLFAGGPPCQGFSKQKRGAHLGDERNRMVLEYARLVRELRPRAFLLENVATFGQRRGRAFVAAVSELLHDYRLTPQQYNCADFGLAQTRRRFIIVGVHESEAGAFTPPPPTTSPWRTVGQAIGDLPEPLPAGAPHPDVHNHQAARVTALNVQRFSHVPQGGGWQQIPRELQLPCHQRVDPSKGGWPDVYGRLRADGQAPTLTGGFDSFTRGRYGHPEQNRPLTAREAARLQGFPDSFHFLGNRGQVRRQLGNAVPPPLAQALGGAIHRALSPPRS